MRAFLALAVLAFVPSSVTAATLTYEFPFVLSGHTEREGFPQPEELRMPHGFPFLQTGWEVPAFDLTLGEPLVLLLELTATPTVTFTLDPPDTGISGPILFLFNPFTGAREDATGYFAHIFPVEGHPVDWTQSVPWAIQTHADSHATYDIRATGIFDITIEGVARATYLYEPVATVVPEPMSLVLLSSGLAGGYCRRRRLRHRHRTVRQSV